jgi:predicted acetyltransferase
LAQVLDYRFADGSDADAAARMVSHSFPGATRPVSWWHDQLVDPPYGGEIGSTLFVGAEAGRIVAACQLHPLLQWFGGRALDVAGVGTVAVSPTHRRRRLGAELMEAALRAARERGAVGSALYPFRASFYRQLGYGDAGDVLQYQVPPGSLPESPERRRVELLDDDAGRAEALAFYGRWARTQAGQLERSARLWTRLVTAHDRLLVGYRAAGGALEGYALAVYRADLPPQARYLEVDEIAWTTTAARRGLYAWLASLGDQWQQLLVRALPSQRMADWLREPRLPWGAAPAWGLWAPAATQLAGPMFRILDMQRAWAQRSIVPEASLVIELDVADAQLPGNAGRWRLVLEDGGARAERNTAGPAGVRLDVSTLSRMFAGSLPATAALAAGLLECDRPELLQPLYTALALPEPWTFDRF